MVVERLKKCDNIVTLSKELGIHRRLLYTWRDKLDPAEIGDSLPENSRESTLRRMVRQLKQVLAGKTVEADFFEGALWTIGVRVDCQDCSTNLLATPHRLRSAIVAWSASR